MGRETGAIAHKRAGRKPDLVREAWSLRFGVTAWRQKHMSSELCWMLCRCLSDDARRLLLDKGEQGGTGWQPQFGYRRFLESGSNPDVTQSTRKDGNILRTPEACGNVPPGNTRRTA